MKPQKKPTEADEKLKAVERWNTEFAAARKVIEPWHKQGRKIVKRFKDERETAQKGESRTNLFSSNVQTQMALLYGQVPKVDVGRRFGDAQDDVARVAGVMLERVLNCDIEDPTDTYSLALWHALQDNRLGGMGLCRIIYERKERPVEAVEAVLDEETGKEIAPAVEATTELESEHCCVEYVPWDKHLWSAEAKTFDKVRWWAFENELSRAQGVKRFGKIFERVPLNAKKGKEQKEATPWDRAVVWEIWSKEDKKVFWYVEGFPQLLDEKDDPLELAGFWPFARPMTANGTTDTLLPTPDFKLSQDLYNEIDDLSTRITKLQEAVAVRGAYDQANRGLQRLLKETAGNELVPISNFAAFMEKGGIAGAVAWLPLEQVVQAIDVLSNKRRELKADLFEVSGMGDIMRGQGTAGSDPTATEQRIKAKFGSARLTQIQGEFARFASDLQRLKAECMSNFYEPETLITLSNIEQTPDAEYAQQAVELIKSRFGMYRVEVKPENVSLADFAEQRGEASEFVAGVSQFLSAATPLIEKIPGALPTVLELLGMVIARFNGFAQEGEAIIDKAIAELKAAQAKAAAAGPQAAPPDPKVEAEKVKAQAEAQKIQLEHAADMERLQGEAQLAASQQQAQTAANIQEEQAKAVIKVQAAHAMPQKPAPVVKGAPR